ncbi:sulfite reductase subunit alpha [Undibacterium baiyunense]|uniref:NADPH--hemoprotein reductase n=1 Tax=Undibacterium baiyunense TaxID=2828731 RepID=A0A941DH49_9BURK|nr:sulfite reductase subunit alpha [Undibacterium baiyunense]MBR7747856.1 flavodoxin domain-containing protein [Undibacterium baiyunense]
MSSPQKSVLINNNSEKILGIGLIIALCCCVLCLFVSLEQYLSTQQHRITTSLSIVFSYVLFYFWIDERHQRAHQRKHTHELTQMQPELLKPTDILIVYASQTGYAEQLAQQTQASLQQGGMQTHLLDIAQLDLATLQKAQQVLFIASTTGEGDAPDSAAKFTRTIMTQSLSLTQCRYAVLALGDRHYQAFCAFGRQLDQWLHQQGAKTLFDTVEVDNGDDGALRHWQHHLGVLSGHTDLADWHPAEYETWTLSERHLLNHGSQGNPVFQIRLTPPASSHWQAGDIAEILPHRPGIATVLPHREYSIASIPEDGAVELIVRQMQQADGSLGWGSGWLCHYAELGDKIQLRLRSNRSFHPPRQSYPLILIGNGTGIAGLRAHLKHRAQQGQHQNWLFFGERQRAHDYFCKADIEQWQTSGVLSKLDLAFSRDQTQRIYVQDKLREQATELSQWINAGAAIYVCGSLEGMAGAVDAVLREIAGDAVIEKMREDGLYRRDVY